MQFNENTKLNDVIHHNYLLLPVLNRFDIQLGFGDKTIKDICAEQGINIYFFLEILNSFHDPDYFPQFNLRSFPLELILNYIKVSHNYYMNVKIPQIGKLIDKLTKSSDNNKNQRFMMIANFFSDYRKELQDHIEDEEKNMHPYILDIEKTYNSGEVNEEIKKQIKNSFLDRFTDDHSNIEDVLYDLKNLIIKYLPPSDDYTLSNTLLMELFRFEQDLNDHARIEDKVLIPKVRLMEKKIFDQ